jgi:hypothetical protein
MILCPVPLQQTRRFFGLLDQRALSPKKIAAEVPQAWQIAERSTLS